MRSVYDGVCSECGGEEMMFAGISLWVKVKMNMRARILNRARGWEGASRGTWAIRVSKRSNGGPATRAKTK
ncbi:hypothetical protein LY76DRAFT_325550 [Colletotrichum caudatum]|nr:hypothetical protein LY76DRAFT_325550 [Colletotrichum caudatum]